MNQLPKNLYENSFSRDYFSQVQFTKLLLNNIATRNTDQSFFKIFFPSLFCLSVSIPAELPIKIVDTSKENIIPMMTLKNDYPKALCNFSFTKKLLCVNMWLLNVLDKPITVILTTMDKVCWLIGRNLFLSVGNHRTFSESFLLMIPRRGGDHGNVYSVCVWVE